MAEYGVINRAFEDVVDSTLCNKHKLRVLNAHLRNLQDGELKDEGEINDLDNILKRKMEITNDIKEQINMCEELLNSMTKLELISQRKYQHVSEEENQPPSQEETQRHQRGRYHVQATDSGYSEGRCSALSGVQDVSEHDLPEQLIVSACEPTKDDGDDDTEC